MRLLNAGGQEIVGNFSVTTLLLMRRKEKSSWKAVQKDGVPISQDHQKQLFEVDVSLKAQAVTWAAAG